jgi:hypothetical protein
MGRMSRQEAHTQPQGRMGGGRMGGGRMGGAPKESTTQTAAPTANGNSGEQHSHAGGAKSHRRGGRMGGAGGSGSGLPPMPPPPPQPPIPSAEIQLPPPQQPLTGASSYSSLHGSGGKVSFNGYTPAGFVPPPPQPPLPPPSNQGPGIPSQLNTPPHPDLIMESEGTEDEFSLDEFIFQGLNDPGGPLGPGGWQGGWVPGAPLAPGGIIAPPPPGLQGPGLPGFGPLALDTGYPLGQGGMGGLGLPSRPRLSTYQVPLVPIPGASGDLLQQPACGGGPTWRPAVVSDYPAFLGLGGPMLGVPILRMPRRVTVPAIGPDAPPPGTVRPAVRADGVLPDHPSAPSVFLPPLPATCPSTLEVSGLTGVFTVMHVMSGVQLLVLVSCNAGAALNRAAPAL